MNNKMKLAELNEWYKQNENMTDELRLVSWGALSYEKKLTLYQEIEKARAAEAERAGNSARAYHRKPEVIQYFKENKLLHESGDYRERQTK